MKREKRMLISTAKQLPYITEEDIEFFSKEDITIIQIENRMIAKRKRWE